MIRTSDGIANLAAALVKAQAVMPNVPKETAGQVGNQIRKYADLATVTASVRPILAEHGLAYVQACSDGAGGFVTVTTRLMHSSGEWLEDSMSMPTGNGSAQAVGSATTYARRYSLMAVLGLAPDDDDGEHASKPAPKPRQKRDAPTAPADPQTRLAMALFGEAGITDRAERLALTSAYVGREVASWSDLTPAERSTVIDRLQEDRS